VVSGIISCCRRARRRAVPKTSPTTAAWAQWGGNQSRAPGQQYGLAQPQYDPPPPAYGQQQQPPDYGQPPNQGWRPRVERYA
jgi:hypothetical protein